MIRSLLTAALVSVASQFGFAQQCPNPSGSAVMGCLTENNSICVPARMCVSGTFSSFTLSCSGLPANTLGIFIYSDDFQTPGLPIANSGRLCLAGAMPGSTTGFVRMYPALSSGTSGTISQVYSGPYGSANQAIVAGQPFYFTMWYRDNLPGGACAATAPPTNFADAWEVTL